jgi:hypothetical protein
VGFYGRAFRPPVKQKQRANFNVHIPRQALRCTDTALAFALSRAFRSPHQFQHYTSSIPTLPFTGNCCISACGPVRFTGARASNAPPQTPNRQVYWCTSPMAGPPMLPPWPLRCLSS